MATKWVVFVDDGDTVEKVTNHLHDGGYFPSHAEAWKFAEQTRLEWDKAGYEVGMIVMPI